jgi:ectoine hydroxylase-related dioxygenase (phytanoyl-CoA dioxygenase family)
MDMSHLSEKQQQNFNRDGYVMVRSLFDKEEIGLLKKSAVEDRELDKHSFGRKDGEGGTVRLTLWNHPGDNIYGMFARCHRVVDSVETLLDGEVYHYHSKMILKDPEIGGAWTWHQDYGYWYQNGVLFPDLISVFIAVDRATRENGCLQVIKGSHNMGRVNHILTGDQAGADMERVNEALKRLDLVYCEMEPGDALFFHSNLLHRSDQNKSKNPRWSLICCYNAARNDPYKDSHHPRYTPLKKVEDSMIKKIGIKRFGEDQTNIEWLDPEKDTSSASLET